MMKTCQMEIETALDGKVAKGAFYENGNAWCILDMGAAFERRIMRIEETGDGPSQGSWSCTYPYPLTNEDCIYYLPFGLTR